MSHYSMSFKQFNDMIETYYDVEYRNDDFKKILHDKHINDSVKHIYTYEKMVEKHLRGITQLSSSIERIKDFGDNVVLLDIDENNEPYKHLFDYKGKKFDFRPVAYTRKIGYRATSIYLRDIFNNTHNFLWKNYKFKNTVIIYDIKITNIKNKNNVKRSKKNKLIIENINKYNENTDKEINLLKIELDKKLKERELIKEEMKLNKQQIETNNQQIETNNQQMELIKEEIETNNQQMELINEQTIIPLLENVMGEIPLLENIVQNEFIQSSISTFLEENPLLKIDFNHNKYFETEEKKYIILLLNNLYKTNEKYSILADKYDILVIWKGLHNDISRPDNSLHFTAQFFNINYTIKTSNYHFYIQNDNIISITSVINLI